MICVGGPHHGMEVNGPAIPLRRFYCEHGTDLTLIRSIATYALKGTKYVYVETTREKVRQKRRPRGYRRMMDT